MVTFELYVAPSVTPEITGGVLSIVNWTVLTNIPDIVDVTTSRYAPSSLTTLPLVIARPFNWPVPFSNRMITSVR
ncbi:hypothetical protein D1872_286480 [compost metagenome]